MNGAESLIRSLVDSGVDVCFGNPGTSEMHFVAALDAVPQMRGVLGLHETVVTGAADGYGRMAGRPAATLLHLGPGMANGAANLHNAKRAATPVVNILGDHAASHKGLDAPLESDIEAIVGWASNWSRYTKMTEQAGSDGAEAVAAALTPPGQVATLMLPADVSWMDGGVPAAPIAPPPRAKAGDSVVADAAAALESGESTVILLGGRQALAEPGLRAAARIAGARGAKLMAETFPARLERGAGLPAVERLGYLSEMMEFQLTGVRHMILVGARSPISFFAYPGKASELVPEGCKVYELAGAGDDALDALERVAQRIGAPDDVAVAPAHRPNLPSGELNVQSMADVIGALLPEGAIVSDESNTSGIMLPAATAGAPRHDWLTLTGGAIGQGLPVATGAAVACPDRPVISLQADGSAMYSISALWTQAREQLDVTTVILNNSAYAILRMELQRVGADTSGEKAAEWLDLSKPDMDFVAIATGMGVPATKATTSEELAQQFELALAEPGPHLIDAVIPPLL